ncbi:MAG: pseudouridine synthase [Clostridia bacterium]
MIRINKYIASAGVCSRRKADELVKSSKVSINGNIVTDLATLVNHKDIVKIDEKKILINEKKVYIMLNKPIGYITTNDEQFGRKCTLDLIHEKVRVFPVGRLDMDTEGLLILTNDGKFANELMHPKNNVEKVYIVTYAGQLSKEQIESLKNGVDIGEYTTKPAKVKRLNSTSFEMTISEGKNRQIRKMCETVEINLRNLKRVKVGELALGTLEVGKYKFLSKKELDSIKRNKNINK